MAQKQAKRDGKPISVDTKAGSLSYNRLEMQISQTLHMAIELYSDLNYLLVLDHYDDITLFDDDVSPETVSYYQMKTSEDSISIDTAISESWVAKLYEKLSNPEWVVKELGLITNCPLKVSVKFQGDDGKPHSEEKKYTAERTPFLSFNPIMVNKLKVDIARRKGIPVNDVDLSKFVHMRTTLSIPKHREIVEQKMSDFLQGQYPRITVESAKTVFGAMMDLLSRCQSYEALDKNAAFAEVRQKKGVSKSDFSRIIEESMYIDVPPFQEIDVWMCYSKEEQMKAALEYTRVLSDVQGKSESFTVLYRQVRNACQENLRGNRESVKNYCERVYRVLPNKNPIYNKAYVSILVASMLINEWRRSV